jgi:hypothetical protein
MSAATRLSEHEKRLAKRLNTARRKRVGSKNIEIYIIYSK